MINKIRLYRIVDNSYIERSTQKEKRQFKVERITLRRFSFLGLLDRTYKVESLEANSFFEPIDIYNYPRGFSSEKKAEDWIKKYIKNHGFGYIIKYYE